MGHIPPLTSVTAQARKLPATNLVGHLRFVSSGIKSRRSFDLYIVHKLLVGKTDGLADPVMALFQAGIATVDTIRHGGLVVSQDICGNTLRTIRLLKKGCYALSYRVEYVSRVETKFCFQATKSLSKGSASFVVLVPSGCWQDETFRISASTKLLDERLNCVMNRDGPVASLRRHAENRP